MILANSDAFQAVVVKIGGSILTDRWAYRRVARFLTNRHDSTAHEGFVVVVSAQNDAIGSQQSG